MLPASLVLLLAKATLVLLAAWGVARLLQRAPAGARHVVWLVTLGGLLLVPALATWAPLRLAVLPAEPAAPVVAPIVAPSIAAASAPGPAESPIVAAASASNGGDATAIETPLVRRVLAFVPSLLALWAAVALVIGASLAKAWLAVRRIIRRAQPLDGHDWLDPMWEIADRLGLDDAPRLLRSADAKMPFACGILRPTIVLPAESDGWSLDRRRAVLLHELAHVRRRDLAGHTLARLTCAVWWFHPLVWTAAKRLRAESERACDDLALSCGARAADYAEHLLDIVTSVRGDATPITALAMARRTEFEGRMLDILDPERPRTAPSRRQTASLVAVLALITVTVSAAAPAPRAAAEPTATPAAPASVVVDDDPEPRDAVSAAPVDVRPETDATTDTRTRTTVERRQRTTTRVEATDESGAPAVALRMLMGRDGQQPPRAEARDERATLLAKVLRTDTSASLRRVAAWGLSEYADESAAAAALAEALRRDASVAVREMAAWSLADSDDDVARAALVAALRDANTRVRATAAWSLGDAGDASSVEALVGALADTSASVRARAIWAIGSIEPRTAPRPLVALLGDRDARVRQLTAWALYEIEDPATAPALQAALRTESEKELQLGYIRALATLGEKSVDALRGLLESSDQNVRTVAVRALAGGHAAGPWPWPWPDPRPHP